jgi:hypothetical protein
MTRRAKLLAPVVILAWLVLLPGCGGDSGNPDGPAKPACGLDIQSLSFGAVTVGESRDLSFKIINTGGGTLAGAASENCADFAIIGNPAYSLEADAQTTITVRFSPTSTGAASCTIETGLSECADMPCTGTGVAPGLCYVHPTSLDFGTVTVGNSSDKAFAITNVGTATLSGSITETSDDYSLPVGGGSYSLPPGDSLTVTVRFAPAAAGTRTCMIETGALCATVMCTGVGELPPACEITVSSLNFGTVEVGAYKDTTFSIINTGGGVLSGDASVTQGAFSIVGETAFSLIATQSATFTVRFAPTSLGPAEGTIDMDSGFCSNIPCTGTGTAAPLCMVNPSTLDFGYLEVGSSADRTFTIQNAGGGTISGTVSSPCADFSIVGQAAFSLGASEVDTFTVRFSPTQPGAGACAIETGSGTCGDVNAAGAGVPHADCYVSASLGSDTDPGTLAAPFKTITHAVATVGPDESIAVLPGTYDTALGETFPIQLVEGQILVGDVLGKGAGSIPTLIYGSGVAQPASPNDIMAVIKAADGCSVEGLKLGAPYAILTFGVYVNDDPVTVSGNTFTAVGTDLYGGVYLTGGKTGLITHNDFATSSYGVYFATSTGGVVVDSNLFVAQPIPLNMVGASNPIIRANTIIGSGMLGIQVMAGAPLIENNTFNKPGGYSGYGAIRCSSATSAPTIRGNSFTCARGVQILNSATPDLGTAALPGGNNFSGVTGPAIYHETISSISAIGNTWAVTPPVCGSTIVLTSSGSVTWGAGPGESCP